jgi:hypothetical protein
MAYAINPYTGLYYQQQPNFPFWPYPLYQPASSISDHVENATATSPDSRQQNIPCGVGPSSPPQRKNPTVGIVGGSEAKRNSWPFIVSLLYNWTNTTERRLTNGLLLNEFILQVGLRRAEAPKTFCGGSIISQTRILTAAHCVNEWDKSFWDRSNLFDSIMILIHFWLQLF